MPRSRMSAAAKGLAGAAGLSALMIGSALTLSAQRNATAPAAATTIKPKVQCAAMANHAIPASAIGLVSSGATITSAVLDLGTGPIPQKPNFIPEHCYMKGVIKPMDPMGGNIEFAI